MKFLNWHPIILAAIIFSNATSYAQGDAPPIKKGTVLTYQVTENGNSYKYVASITKFSAQDGIAVEWKDTEQPAKSGSFEMRYKNTEDATALQVKITEGKESFGTEDSRIFISDAMTKDISFYHLQDIKVDGTAHSFLFINTTAEEKEINYNNKKIKVDYNSGEDKDVYIGIINLENAKLLGIFAYKKYAIELISVTN